jgi:hypothetical protein
VNEAAKRRVATKRSTRASYEKAHGIVFDDYGRVLRWGRQVDGMDCGASASGKYEFKVTDFSYRKYRTKDEEKRQKTITLDKQAEVDDAFGSRPDDAKRKMRLKKENKERCALFSDWLSHFEADKSEKHTNFFNTYLDQNYADFHELRSFAKSGAGPRVKRKASKVYRHIALHTHTDKLPPQCRGEPMQNMMR